MFGTCNGCCGSNNRGLFGLCLNDSTLIIILVIIWLLSGGYGRGCGCGCD